MRATRADQRQETRPQRARSLDECSLAAGCAAMGAHVLLLADAAHAVTEGAGVARSGVAHHVLARLVETNHLERGDGAQGILIGGGAPVPGVGAVIGIAGSR